MRSRISWLLVHSEGINIVDKISVFFVKLIYLSFRIILRIALGKKRRDKLWTERGLNFGVFWSKFFKFRRESKKDGAILSQFKMPRYSFEFYCRNNKDDFETMTFHEDDIVEHFTPDKGDIVVDIGAHIGLYTIIASKRVGFNGRVVAIEADPGNFNILNRNIQLNNSANVIALKYAVYSKEEENLKLFLPNPGESTFTKYNTIMSDRAQSKENFVEVKANTLDYLLQSNGIKQEEVNWIKIDVEGAEYEVLKGAKDILSKSTDISLLIEIHNLSGGTNLYKPIIEYLNLYHFKIDFEKIYDSGERHIIARKKKNNSESIST
jgi:FkbM family methyltransferase